jgi:hypothetical protein
VGEKPFNGAFRNTRARSWRVCAFWKQKLAKIEEVERSSRGIGREYVGEKLLNSHSAPGLALALAFDDSGNLGFTALGREPAAPPIGGVSK